MRDSASLLVLAGESRDLGRKMFEVYFLNKAVFKNKECILWFFSESINLLPFPKTRNLKESGLFGQEATRW